MKVLKNMLLPTLLLCLSSFVGKMQPITIFMIGDSTMANKKLSNGNIERGWGQMLPDLLTDEVQVRNHAKDGRSTRSFIAEGRWDAVLAELKKGDYVFIQFGHNDEKTDSTLHTVPGGSFDENLRRFVSETRARGGIPVLFNSIVRRNFPPEGMKEHRYVYDTEGTVLVDTHGAYRGVPAKIAREMSVPFVDANQLTHKLVEGLGMEESKKLFMWVPAGKYAFCPKGKVDNTHLNIQGARTVASLLINATVEVLPELKAYLRMYDPEVYVAPYKDDKQCAISYTFDDGLLEHYTEEVATYVKERKNTRLDICKGESEWVVTPSLSLDSQLFNHPLTLILNLNLGNRIKKAWQNGKRVSVRKWNEKYLLEFNPHGGSIRVKLK